MLRLRGSSGAVDVEDDVIDFEDVVFGDFTFQRFAIVYLNESDAVWIVLRDSDFKEYLVIPGDDETDVFTGNIVLPVIQSFQCDDVTRHYEGCKGTVVVETPEIDVVSQREFETLTIESW